MTRHDQHAGATQPDPGRSGRRPKPTKRWERPDVPRPGPRHPQRPPARATVARPTDAEVRS